LQKLLNFWIFAIFIQITAFQNILVIVKVVVFPVFRSEEIIKIIVINCLKSFILLCGLITIICRCICLWKIIRIFFLKIIVFPKALECLLISCLKLVFSNLSWSLARKSEFCIFIWVLNAIIHIVSCSLPLYSRIFYRVRTLGYNPIKFGCLNVSFVFQSYFINFKSKLIIFIIFF